MEPQPVRGNKVVVVTGATGGIGKALTEALYVRGAHTVIAACRTPKRLEDIRETLAARYPDNGSEIIGLQLDLGSYGAVDSAVDALRSLGLRIDGLINNAGTMPLRTLSVSPDGHEYTMQVNCLSTLRFTLGVLPLMRRGGNVVFTTSVTRRLPKPTDKFDEANLNARTLVSRFLNYGRSKQVLTFTAALLAEREAVSGIRFNCADPGVVDSGIITLGYPVVDKLADRLFRPLISTPAQGAEAALRALDTDRQSTVSTRHATRSLSNDAYKRVIGTHALSLAGC